MSILDVAEGAVETAASPWKLWLIGGALVVTVTSAGVWLHSYGTARFAAGALEAHAKDNEEKLRSQQVALKTAADNAAETARRLAAQQKAQEDHDKALATARADAAASAAAAVGLRSQLAQYVAAARSRGAPGNPAAPVIGSPARDPLDLLADLYGRADDRAGALSEYADAARIAGNQCVAAYEALNGTNP